MSLCLRAISTLALIASLTGADTQTTFGFHSNFWVNLHHFLYQQAGSKTPEPCDSKDWQHALDEYRRDFTPHELMSRDIGGINMSLSRLKDDEPLKDAGFDAELTELLERAAPVYRERWWPQHSRDNLAWIAAATPLVVKYEAVMKKELSAAFQTPWPTEPILTDVSEYANWSGAYTMLKPTHITISSHDASNAGPATLETLFHEGSHALIKKVSDALDTELASQKRDFPRRAFWHAVLFYTTGHFAEKNLETYTQYGVKNGVFDRAWPGAFPILEKDWKPYLDGKVDMATAVRNLVADYGVPKKD